MYTCIHTYTHILIYIYIYIYDLVEGLAAHNVVAGRGALLGQPQLKLALEEALHGL